MERMAPMRRTTDPPDGSSTPPTATSDAARLQGSSRGDTSVPVAILGLEEQREDLLKQRKEVVRRNDEYDKRYAVAHETGYWTEKDDPASLRNCILDGWTALDNLDRSIATLDAKLTALRADAATRASAAATAAPAPADTSTEPPGAPAGTLLDDLVPSPDAGPSSDDLHFSVPTNSSPQGSVTLSDEPGHPGYEAPEVPFSVPPTTDGSIGAEESPPPQSTASTTSAGGETEPHLDVPPDAQSTLPTEPQISDLPKLAKSWLRSRRRFMGEARYSFKITEEPAHESGVIGEPRYDLGGAEGSAGQSGGISEPRYDFGRIRGAVEESDDDDDDGEDEETTRSRWWMYGVFGIVAVVALLLGGTLSGIFSGSSPATKTSGTKSSLSAPVPTFTGRLLEFSAVGVTSSTTASYSIVLRPGTAAGQFVESDSFPSTNSAQIQTETFSSSGVHVTSLQTSSPSGTSSFQFTTPLPVIVAPYVVGRSWSVTSTGTSTSGSDTVQVMDRIAGITKMTLAGTSLQVVQLDIHHIITESTPSGTVRQESTGTEYFAPLLGVFVSGESTEVTGTRSTTNRFQLVSIGAPTSGSSTPTGTPSTPGSTNNPTSSSQGAPSTGGSTAPPACSAQAGGSCEAVSGGPVGEVSMAGTGTVVVKNATTGVQIGQYSGPGTAHFTVVQGEGQLLILYDDSNGVAAMTTHS